jgi:hypothetical protein
VDTGPTGLDYFTLAIAIAGFLLSGLAFGWQMFTWLNEGARVKVDAPVFVVVAPEGSDAVSVSVRNVGRSAVEVTGMWGRIGSQRFFMIPPAGQASLPYTLNGLHSVAWAMPTASLRKALASTKAEGEMRVGIMLATGREVWSPKRKTLDVSALRS